MHGREITILKGMKHKINYPYSKLITQITPISRGIKYWEIK